MMWILISAEIQSRWNRLLVEAGVDLRVLAWRRRLFVAALVPPLLLGIGVSAMGSAIRQSAGIGCIAVMLGSGFVLCSTEPAQLVASMQRRSTVLIGATGVAPGVFSVATCIGSSFIPFLTVVAALIVTVPSVLVEWQLEGLGVVVLSSSAALLVMAFRLRLGLAWSVRLLTGSTNRQALGLVLIRALVAGVVSLLVSVGVTRGIADGLGELIASWGQRAAAVPALWGVGCTLAMLLVAVRFITAALMRASSLSAPGPTLGAHTDQCSGSQSMEREKDARVRSAMPGLAIETWGSLAFVATASVGVMLGISIGLGDDIPAMASLAGATLTATAVVSLTGSALRPVSSLDAEGPAAMLWVRIPGVLERRVRRTARRHAVICVLAAACPILGFVVSQRPTPWSVVAVGCASAVAVCMTSVAVPVGAALHPRLDWSYPDQIGNHPQAAGFETVVEMIGWPLVMAVVATLAQFEPGGGGAIAWLVGAAGCVAVLTLSVPASGWLASAVWRRSGVPR